MADLSLVSTGKLSVVESFIQETLPAGAAIGAGDVVTFSPTTGKWVKADADATDGNAPLYVALKSVAAGVGLTAIKKGVVDGLDLSALAYGAPVFLSKSAGKIATAVVVGTEVQTVTIGAEATGGTFKLSFRGEQTAAIAHNAAAAAVDAALEALASIGAGNVAVTGDAGGPYTVTFGGALAGEALPLLVLSENKLDGEGADVTIVETTAGISQRQVGYVIPAAYTTLGTAYDKLLAVDC
jgi:hypothetical protein